MSIAKCGAHREHIGRSPRVAGGFAAAAALALAMLALGFPPRALAQVRGTIVGPGDTAFPIAVAPLGGSGGEPCSRRFVETLSRDLDLSGLFRVVEASAAAGAGDPPAGDTGGSAAVAARLLVNGTCEVSGEDVVLDGRLLDTAERRELGAMRYKGTRRDVRRMGNRFADEILRILTGERGPFDSRIAFVSTRAGRAKELYEMSFDGADVRQLTHNSTINLSPSWAPDARRLLFTSFQTGRPRLYEIDIASGRETVILSGPGLTNGGRFSPNGEMIAASREESKGNSEIVLLDDDGGVLRALAAHGGIDVSPTWSPDGTRIAFCSTRGGSPQIYVTDTAGAAPRRVTYNGSYNTSPVWSPKGDKIAYTGRVGGRFQIFVVPASGGEATQLTASAGDNTDASWSPDGRYLVFASTRAGASQLYLMDERGQRPRQLIRGPGGDTNPAWSSWIE